MKRVGIIAVFMLVLLVFSFSDSSAQIGFKGVGGRLGFVSASGVSTIVFGAHVNLGEIIPGLVIVPSIDYWSESLLNWLSINGNVRYYFPTGGNIELFGGGGLAFNRTSVDIPVIPGFTTGGSVSSTGISLNLMGGADMPLSDNLVGTAMIMFNTDASQIKIMGGVTYMLGQ